MLHRRQFILTSAAMLLVAPTQARSDVFVPPRKPRRLHLLATADGETFRATYWADGRYIPEALVEVSNLLRDRNTGEMCDVDPQLLDFLWQVQHRLDTPAPFHVTSGYRSEKTNARLVRRGRAVSRSYHTLGRAADLWLPGRSLEQIRRAAEHLDCGGVGYYPKSGFVHLDSGPSRCWQS